MNVNSILRKAQPKATASDIQAAFAHANTSKTFNRHHLANALFAFLLECHRDGATDLRIGLEYLPKEDRGITNMARATPFQTPPSG